MRQPRRFAIMLLANIASLAVAGQTISESKKLYRAYPLTRETNVEVTNKYGMVHVETWDKDSVQIQIQATATGKTGEDVEEILNNIDFQFVYTCHYIVAKTIFINPTKLLIKDLASIFGKTNDVSIDYKILVPSWANLEIGNKYGDIYTSSLAGHVDINLSYGKLKAYSFEGPLDLQLAFGGADITKIKSGNISVSYSNLHVKSATSLQVKSNFSDINIDQAGDILLNSQYDKANITEVETCDIASNFSTTNISYLARSLQAEARFGTLNVNRLSPSFTKATIIARYTDVSLLFDLETTGLDLEISHKKSRITYPRGCNLREESINTREAQYRSTGHMGTSKGDAQVYIETHYGDVTLKKR